MSVTEAIAACEATPDCAAFSFQGKREAEGKVAVELHSCALHKPGDGSWISFIKRTRASVDDKLMLRLNHSLANEQCGDGSGGVSSSCVSPVRLWLECASHSLASR